MNEESNKLIVQLWDFPAGCIDTIFLLAADEMVGKEGLEEIFNSE